MIMSRVNDAAEDLLAKVCRATPAEARRLGLDLSHGLRVQLALFCYGRAHLRQHGLELARECSLQELIKACGAPMAATIRDQMEHGIPEPRDPTLVRKPTITLPGGQLYVVAPVSSELESESA